MIDWIMEGIVKWLGSTVTALMDAVSGFFLSALGTDMTAMEEYFPFAEQAFTVLQYTAWALLFLITVWQLVRSLGGPLTDAESPLMLLARSALFAFLIAYVDSAIKIIIALVVGALLLGGLYALFKTTVLPTMTEKITEMFSYSGT